MNTREKDLIDWKEKRTKEQHVKLGTLLLAVWYVTCFCGFVILMARMSGAI